MSGLSVSTKVFIRLRTRKLSLNKGGEAMTEKKQVRYFQKIGEDVYRVSGAVRRSAVTGRYVTKGSASRGLKKKPTVSTGNN